MVTFYLNTLLAVPQIFRTKLIWETHPSICGYLVDFFIRETEQNPLFANVLGNDGLEIQWSHGFQ